MTATEIRGEDAFRTLTALCLCTLSLGKKKNNCDTTLEKENLPFSAQWAEIKLKATLLFPLVFEI